MQMIVNWRILVTTLLLLSTVMTCRRSSHEQSSATTGPLLPQQHAAPGETPARAGEPPQPAVDGRYLKAVLVALPRHQEIADLTERQKQPESYTFTFSENDQYIHVVFVPKIPEGSFPLGSDTEFGRSARYTVAKDTYLVVEQTFFE